MTLDSLPLINARDIPYATAEQMALADETAAKELRVASSVLMENASRQIAATTRLFFGGVGTKDVVAVVGKGNNGGDALGVLAHLRKAGALVEAYTVAPRLGLGWLAGLTYDRLARTGVTLNDAAASDDRTIVERLKRADIVLDGLLGFGATGAPRGEIARLIALTIAGATGKVVAVDLPSGLHPDTGKLLDEEHGAVRAALTVTLGLPKPGLLVAAARTLVGELVLADIGMPWEALARLGIETRDVFSRGSLLHIAF